MEWTTRVKALPERAKNGKGIKELVDEFLRENGPPCDGTPPFINSMSKDFRDEANAAFAAKLKRSKLYMIGARPRTEFGDVRIVDTVNDLARVEIKLAGETVDWGYINLQANVPLGGAVHAAWDDQIIQIGHNRPGPGEKMHSHTWYTPDSVYWEKSRGNPNLQGFNNHAIVCNYDLLYVGIANKQDSFERLLNKAHQGRVEIRRSQ
ncbi:hypothetical protein [Pseudomonas putida]|uniref:hypothetical protein n=1 Tax=Pseudomonas putida TaxID=303 RepID=UPI002B24BD3B|nr:hypothetical protein [Pseudomonas putida]